jgi:hypothetical protein
MANLPRIAICFPSYDMVHADFALALAGMCASLHPMPATIVNNKSSIVAQARNNGVEAAQNFNADYMLFLDSDMTFPSNTLHRLLSHKKDIVGAIYTKRVPPYKVLGKPLLKKPVLNEHGLIEMTHMPTGCLLIRLKVYNDLKKPYFRFLFNEENGALHGEDYVFCDMAREAGFQIWCDVPLSQEIGHIGQQVCRLPKNFTSPAKQEPVPTPIKSDED